MKPHDPFVDVTWEKLSLDDKSQKIEQGATTDSERSAASTLISIKFYLYSTKSQLQMPQGAVIVVLFGLKSYLNKHASITALMHCFKETFLVVSEVWGCVSSISVNDRK